MSLLNCTEAHAQRAKKHREGVLTADSIRTKNQTDSLALADTTDLQRQLKLETLEAPVDTALLARQNDSIQNSMPAPQEKKRWIPNSNRTVWLGLIIPGAGQIYNRKYWKLPIIYGGFVGCAYALRWNNMMYRDYSQAYLDIMDDDPTTESYNQFLHLGNTITDSNLAQYQEIFRKRKDRYRRWRDMSVFALIAVYALSVIDAYVDASLSEFDISPDLSFHVTPAIINNSTNTNAYALRSSGIGVQCSLTF